MTAPILIVAVGNESRGDDALGPLLLRQLDEWVQQEGLAGQFEFLEEFQLQIENVVDMKDRRLVLFIDAGMDTSDPFEFYPAQKSDVPVLYSHALEPSALLNVYEQFNQQQPPATFVLCIRGEQFELGEALSGQAASRLLSAFEHCKRQMLGWVLSFSSEPV